MSPEETLMMARGIFDCEVEELRAIRDRLDASFIEAVEILHAAVSAGRKIVVAGVGKSGNIGEKIAATLTSTGAPSVVLDALNALHGDLGIVQDGDALIALSYSGETEELNSLIPALKRFAVRIIAITGNPNSFLGRSADVRLDVRVKHEACPLRLAPTSSTTAMLVTGDALAMVLLSRRGFTREDFAKFHPGGRLGRTLLLRVEQIMRGRDLMAVVRPETPVRETLRAMAKARTGCAVIEHADGTLAGVFTHGDFGRQFDRNPDFLDCPVGDVMTRGPVTIGAGQLAVDVLHVLERHRIDDLVAVDAAGRAAGLVDTQDLARYRLL